MSTTVLLKPPNFADEPPFGGNGINDFYLFDSGRGSWHLTGTADAGVAMQDDDGKLITAVNPIDGLGIGSVGEIIFKDEGEIPGGSTIISVELIVKMAVVGVNMDSTTGQGFAIGWDSFSSAPLIGANTDDFTGTGIYTTGPMLFLPGSSTPWVYDDIYGASLPFSDPKGFQGWWAMQGYTGLSSDPNTSSFAVDSVNLSVVYGDASQAVSNWDFDAILHHSREWGVMRVS